VSPVTIGFLAALFLSFIPLVIGMGSFFVLLKLWIPALLNDEKVKGRLSFAFRGDEAEWSIRPADIPWPSAQLEWAVAAGLAAMLCGMIAVSKDLDFNLLWFAAGAAAAAAAVATPLVLRFFSPHKLRRLVERELISPLRPRGLDEALRIREIGRLGKEIEDSYAALGMKTRLCAADICKEILIRRATGDLPDAAAKFSAVQDSLGRFYVELRSWIEAQQGLRSEFELVKNLIMDNGSVTLLGEVDRIRAEMTSDRLAGALDRGRWDEAGLLVEQVGFDLKMVRNMAEGGSDVPQSLGEACRILSVAKSTPRKTVKAVVDALRRVWHPDLSQDDDERELRTIRTRQINIAWEIFIAAEAAGEPVPGEEPAPTADPLPPNPQ